jgi:hypothetical protein
MGFVLAITEVNTFLAVRYFTFANGTLDGCPTLLKFRRDSGMAVDQQ